RAGFGPWARARAFQVQHPRAVVRPLVLNGIDRLGLVDFKEVERNRLPGTVASSFSSAGDVDTWKVVADQRSDREHRLPLALLQNLRRRSGSDWRSNLETEHGSCVSRSNGDDCGSRGCRGN